MAVLFLLLAQVKFFSDSLKTELLIMALMKTKGKIVNPW
jgi:hypothetical protein